MADDQVEDTDKEDVADKLKLINAGEGDTITIIIERYSCYHERGSSDTQEQRKEHKELFKDTSNIVTGLFGYADVSGLVLVGRIIGYLTNENEPVYAYVRVRENAFSEEDLKQLNQAEAAYAGDISVNDDSLDVFLVADVGTKQMLVSGLSNNTRCDLNLTVGNFLNTEKAWVQNFELKLSGKTADYKTNIDFVDDEELEVPEAERHWDIIKKLNTIERMAFWLVVILVFVVVIVVFK